MEHQLSDQQLAFMRVLWEHGEASVGDVKKGLAAAGCELAPTSVATVLSRLAKKGLVEHRTSGRHFVYRALVSENEVRRSVLQRVTQGLFAGDVTALVSSLLETEKVSTSELEEVKKMIWLAKALETDRSVEMTSIITETTLRFIFTYLLHSSLLIVGVWASLSLLAKIPKLGLRVPATVQNTLWKVALLGGLATTTFQIAGGHEPMLGGFAIPGQAEPEPALGPLAMELPASAVLAPAAELEAIGDNAFFYSGTALPLAAGLPAATFVEAPAPAAPAPAPIWPMAVVIVIGAGSIFALGRLALAVRRLRRTLADRRTILEDPVLESFLELKQRAGLRRKLRLSASNALSTPVALLRAEVCLPEKAIEKLSPTAMRGVLAHELAHIERRDPLWLAISAIVEALLFFQPLNRLARRGMQDSAELLADDRAVELTGDGVTLAKTLAEVAAWHRGPISPVLVGMAMGDRPLVRRVTRLLEAHRESSRGFVPGRIALTLGILLLLGLAAPGAVSASPPDAPEPPLPPEAPAPAVFSLHPHGSAHHDEQQDAHGTIIIRQNGEEIRIETEGDGQPRRRKLKRKLKKHKSDRAHDEAERAHDRAERLEERLEREAEAIERRVEREMERFQRELEHDLGEIGQAPRAPRTPRVPGVRAAPRVPRVPNMNIEIPREFLDTEALRQLENLPEVAKQALRAQGWDVEVHPNGTVELRQFDPGRHAAPPAPPRPPHAHRPSRSDRSDRGDVDDMRRKLEAHERELERHRREMERHERELERKRREIEHRQEIIEKQRKEIDKHRRKLEKHGQKADKHTDKVDKLHQKESKKNPDWF